MSNLTENSPVFPLDSPVKIPTETEQLTESDEESFVAPRVSFNPLAVFSSSSEEENQVLVNLKFNTEIV